MEKARWETDGIQDSISGRQGRDCGKKKSRFIAEVFLVHSEEEAMQYLEQIRKSTGMQGITAGPM